MNNVSINCWICGSIATTREHNQKKSDVEAFLGKGPYKNIVKIDFDTGSELPQKRIIQGPNSQELKYEKNLCARCNNVTTQPFDRAYERFCTYIRSNSKNMMNKMEINMGLIYGKKQAKRQQKNLFNYFVKAFGCQLNSRNIEVPEEFIRGLQTNNDIIHTYIYFFIGDNYQLNLQNFPLIGYQDSNGKPINYCWAQHNGYINILYTYNHTFPLIPPILGEKWCGKSKIVRVGRYKIKDLLQNVFEIKD